MRKLIALALGVVLFFGAVFGFNLYLDGKIAGRQENLRGAKVYSRYWSHDVNAQLMDEKTLLLFGSSELNTAAGMTDGWEKRRGDFLNGEDIRVITIGGGNFQSLSHAIALGSLSGEIQSGKVALILSPQWFLEKDGIDATAFAARFSEDHLLHLLDNPAVSRESKEYVLSRTLQLLKDSPTQYKRVLKYQASLDDGVGLNYCYRKIMTPFWSFRTKWQAWREAKDYNEPQTDMEPAKTDFSKLLAQAEEAGRMACNNNDFGIYDSYWDTYVLDRYEAGEEPEKVQAAVESVEYDDLRCFLQIASEVGVEVLLVNVPVNAPWYAYTGQLFDDYYENIRSVAAEYDQVRLLDMSGFENEKYFLKDIMHLGWKGWVRVNEALYQEFVRK